MRQSRLHATTGRICSTITGNGSLGFDVGVAPAGSPGPTLFRSRAVVESRDPHRRDVDASDGVSTKTVKGRSLHTSPETGGTTTCIGIPDAAERRPKSFRMSDDIPC